MKSIKRIISVIMSLVLIVGVFACMSGLPAFAVDNTPEPKAVSEQTADNNTEKAEKEGVKAEETASYEKIVKAPKTTATTASVKNAATSGSCGYNLTWEYDIETATLTISGTGAMSDYSFSSYNGYNVTTAPWREYYNKMKTVVINSGVTSIGDYAFYRTGLTSVTIGNNVTSIGNDAFYLCTYLTSITIPDSVTSIGWGAFWECYNLMNFSIGNGVISIGSTAFFDCENLTSITIPDSVTSIGNRAFWRCTRLTSVTIGNGVTSIGDHVFDGCTGLTSVTIGNSVTSISESAFYYCSGLTNVNYTGTIADWCNISFGGGLANPLNYAHNLYINDVLITDLAIPDTVKKINNHAFRGCTGLTSVTIPDSVTSIGNSAFDGCTGLTSITIPDGVTSIGDYAFYNCTSLTSVTIGKGVTSIGNYAFYGCKGLTSITIPDSVTSIGGSAFSGCSSLQEISLPFIGDKRHSTSDTYQYPFGYIFGTSSYTGSTATQQTYYGSSTSSTTNTTYYIPSSLRKVTITGSEYIPYGAFTRCTGLTSITLSSGIKTIGADAFWGCTELTSIKIPNSVTSIGNYAFYNCIGLGEAVFEKINEDGTETINPMVKLSYNGHTYALFNTNANWTSAKEICETIGGHLATITSEAEWNFVKNIIDNNVNGSYCWLGGTDSETEGVWKWVTGEEFSYSRWNQEEPNNTSGIEHYIGTWSNSEWNDFPNYNYNYFLCEWEKTDVEDSFSMAASVLNKGNITLGTGVFQGCSNLINITLSSGIKTIGADAFSGCEALERVDYTGTITEWNDIVLGNYKANPIVFAHNLYINSELLTDLVIPDGVTSIGRNIFNRCYSIKSVVLPDSVKEIKWGAFSWCTGIKDFTIPDGVTVISDYTFEGCTGLTSIIIPDKVTSINSHAFDGCSSLTSITIPDSVQTIGDYAFLSCTGLNKLVILSKNATISSNAIPKTTTIYCYEGSSAETYAKANGINYFLLSSCGNNLGYYKSDNTLYIVGTGAMDNYKMQSGVPWYDYRDEITEVRIASGVTKVGTYAFYCLDNLESVITNNNNLEFGRYAIDTNNEQLTVYAVKGGAVENYCEQNGVIFVDPTPVAETPAAPDYEAHTESCITLVKNNLYEYSIDGEYWQKSNVFTGLKKNIIYRFYQRVAATNTEYASDKSPALIIAIPDKPVALSTTDESITLKAVEGFEYCLDDFVWQKSTTFDMLIEGMDYDIYQRIATIYGEKVYQITSDKITVRAVTPCAKHTYSGWEKDAENHWHTCSRCGIAVDLSEHIYGNWQTSVSPKCTEKGEEKRTCTVCGAFETRDIAALGHDYNAVVTAPNCTEKGYTTHTCSRCSNSYKDAYINATGHNFGEWVATKVPNCTEKGEEKRTCTVCGTVETREIAALGHTFSEWVAITAPTCTTNGEEERKCYICGHKETRSVEKLSSEGYVYYGSYPQSQVKDTNLIELLNNQLTEWISYNKYYMGEQTDIMQYQDVVYNGVKYRAVYIKSSLLNNTQIDNTSESSQRANNYLEGNTYWFKFEPIKWRVLDKNSGLVVCESIIDSTFFNHVTDGYSNCYANSDLRQWLSNVFLNTAFSDDEKQKINTSSIKSNDYSSSGGSDNNAEISDRIFLLSYSEANNSNYGFSNNASRVAYGTEYAKCMGLDNVNYWRLRSAGSDRIYTCFVNTSGGINNFNYVTNTNSGIRPAMRLSPSILLTSSHSFGEWVATKVPNCTEKGEETRTCAVCGTVETREVAALGHNWSTEWSGNNAKHWHECTRCSEKNDIALHVFDNEEDLICNICGIETVYMPGDFDGDGEVTDADAVYLLFYTFFPEDYPIDQPCDFNGDGKTDDQDAVYLLFYTFFPEDYPIE